jgi:hypothetical protein
MSRKVVGLAILLAAVSLLCELSKAQYFAKMSDERWIELALDMVRKGMQEQDTAKVFMVFAPKVLVKGKDLSEKADLVQRVQTVFDNSSSRRLLLDRPSLPGENDPRRLSNFWDFDILEPKITIKDDSAFVDCELVLWGATPDGEGRQHGRRVKERFIFYSPPRVELTTLPEDSRRFPESPPGKNITHTRGWQLVGYESLVEFVENQVNVDAKPAGKAQTEQK